MHAADGEQLDRVAALVSDVLDANVLGAYLFGSAVLGGLGPESDLDVLAVLARPTTRPEKAALAERLLAISGRRTEDGRWRRVELTLVVQAEVRPWRFPPRMDFQYGDWLRGEFESGDVEPWPSLVNPDLATLLAMVLLADAPLLGPPPAELLDPVPASDLARAAGDAVEPLLADLEDDTRNVLLTLARIWTTAETGAVRSKADAADWALARLPAQLRAPLERARAIYVGAEPERWDDLRQPARALADHLVAEIRRQLAQNRH